MQQLRAALFDLDGVIFDTERQYDVFWGEQCRRYHPEHPGLEQEIKGQTLVQIFDRHFAGQAMSGVRQLIVQGLNDFEAHMSYDYIRGFLPFLADLRHHSVKTAVVTSSNQPKMESVYRAQPLFRTLFDAILTSEDFEFSKPHPDCYLKGAARFGAEPSECIVFEDSVNGLKAGRAAGMKVVGLLTTTSQETVAQLSDIQVRDYQGLDYASLVQLL